MSVRRDSDYLFDIQEAIRRVAEYAGEFSYEQFRKDTRTQDAVIRNLEIIGEATKGLSASFRKQHTDIPWKQMAAMRDRFIHHYFGINLDIVWGVATEELPAVAEQIETLRKDCLF
ncbi:MAG: hypothetical protein B6I25_07865 [Planctomycetales bacterium 4572_13]|nr:MAG: hypothetical protein B6I25_07865 [Planctomycetales bacterium 4572_13]